jgi:hypothetical protein
MLALPNKGLQRTALRAGAEADRWARITWQVMIQFCYERATKTLFHLGL